jgi:hypothetical protein
MQARPIRAAILLLVTVICMALVADAAWRARGYRVSTSDFDDFHQTVTHDLLGQGTATAEYGVHDYLPFFVVLMAPFGLLPMWLACAVFVALSLLLFSAAVWLVDRHLVDQPRGPTWLRLGAPVVMVSPFVVSAAVLGQVGLLVTFLVVLCWYLVEAGRPGSAGIILSLAVLIKILPGVLILYFVLKRQWRVLGGVLAGLVVFGVLLTALVFGPAEDLRLHRKYFERAVVGHGALAELVNTEHAKSTAHNQSLPMVLRRLLTDTIAGTDDNGPWFVSAVHLPDEPVGVAGMTLQPVQWVYVGVVAAVLGWLCMIARHSARVIGLRRRRLEFAAFTMLCLVLSPLMWVHYLVLGYYALALLTAELMHRVEAGRREAAARVVWFAWLASLPLLASPWCRAVGAHLWCAVAVMVVLGIWASRLPPVDLAPAAGARQANG